MTGRLPPISDPSFGGKAQNALDQLQLQKHTRNTPVKLPPYTVLTVPPPANWAECLIYVTNGASGLSVAVSDGTNWRWMDGTIIT